MESTWYYQGLQSRAQGSVYGSVRSLLEKRQQRNNNSIMKPRFTRNEIFDLLNEEISDELLLAINEERAQLFREVIKHRNIVAQIAEQVQTYNRLLDQNEKRLTMLLTDGEGW